MQVLGSRRGGLITLTIAAVALVVAAAFAVWQLIERPSVDPIAPGARQLRLRPEPARSPFGVPATDERLGDLKVTARRPRRHGRRVREDGDLAIVAAQEARRGHPLGAASASAAATSSRARSARAGSSTLTPRPRSWRVAAPAAGRRSRPAGPRRSRAPPSPAPRDRRRRREDDRRPPPAPTGAWKMVARLPEGAVTAKVTAHRRRRQRHHAPPPPDGRHHRARSWRSARPPRARRSPRPTSRSSTATVRSDNPRALRFAVRVNGAKVVDGEGRRRGHARRTLEAELRPGRRPRPRPSRSTAAASRSAVGHPAAGHATASWSRPATGPATRQGHARWSRSTAPTSSARSTCGPARAAPT